MRTVVPSGTDTSAATRVALGGLYGAAWMVLEALSCRAARLPGWDVSEVPWVDQPLLVQQSADGEVVVDPLSARSGDRRVGPDFDATPLIARDQLAAIAAAAVGSLCERVPVGTAEDDPVARALGAVAVLVQQPMVVATEEDEVRELRLAATCPVLQVVGVDKPAPVTARKLAAAVAAT
jgi:hypothetical protein